MLRLLGPERTYQMQPTEEEQLHMRSLAARQERQMIAGLRRQRPKEPPKREQFPALPMQ